MPAARVDVIIPVHNGAATVESAVASIQAQTVPDIRIIVIDDGSTDGTPEIVAGLAACDPRVLLLRQPKGGIVDALNAGLARCDAEMVARHDADDLATPDRFARQLAALDADPDCVALSGAVRHIDAAGRPLGTVVSLPSPDLADLSAVPQREPYLIHPFLMARRSALHAIGGYRHVFHAEDTDLYWRLQEKGRLRNLPDILGDYRVHDQSITGGSVVNGRISAVSAQLAGLSAVRRRSGLPDLPFPKSALPALQEARALEAIVQVASTNLDTAETRRLGVLACAKLLELANYRPYELDDEDCAYIRATLVPALPGLTPADRRLLRRMLSGTAARLAHGGRLARALRLAPSALYPLVAARLAVRAGAPRFVRQALRRSLGRAAFAK